MMTHTRDTTADALAPGHVIRDYGQWRTVEGTEFEPGRTEREDLIFVTFTDGGELLLQASDELIRKA